MQDCMGLALLLLSWQEKRVVASCTATRQPENQLEAGDVAQKTVKTILVTASFYSSDGRYMCGLYRHRIRLR